MKPLEDADLASKINALSETAVTVAASAIDSSRHEPPPPDWRRNIATALAALDVAVTALRLALGPEDEEP